MSFSTNSPTLKDLYGFKNSFSTCELFKGKFINFGYWDADKIVHKDYINDETRAEASRKLYKTTTEYLNIKKNDVVLDVGCGLGAGCMLMHQLYQPKKIIGIDPSKKHIDTNKTTYKHKTICPIHFKRCHAENIILPNNSVSKIVSVEAIQHFQNYNAFFREVLKVLRYGGEVVITSFFATSTDALSQLSTLIPTIKNGTDKAIPIKTLIETLKYIKFKKITYTSIGPYVWHGFDQWISQTQYKNTWNRNWLKAYEDKLIDYYIIHATKG